MRNTREPSGRISDHFQGLGTATRATVENRAKEIAIINGRAPQDFTENDWVQAKHELLGVQDLEEIEQEEPASLIRWDENPETAGHRVEIEPAVDEQTVAERLVEEGIEEANHDRMLKGSLPEESER